MTESEKFFKNVLNAVLSLTIENHVNSMKSIERYESEDGSRYIQESGNMFEPQFFGKGSKQGFTVSVIRTDKGLFRSHKYICIVRVDSGYGGFNKFYYNKKEHEKDIKQMYDHLVKRNLDLENSRREQKFKEYNENLSKFITKSQIRDEKISELLGDK
jgi:hypothetical protein